ncbi:MAG TPA: hypothetical protein VGA89_00780, partial [Patescibacteria group bacterium]
MSLIINTKFLINETKVQKKTHSSWLTSQLSKASSLDEYIVFLNDWSQLRKSLISYIYKQIFTKKEKQHTALCLYGSGVSGNLTSKSDLDIILLYNSRFLSKDEIEKKFAIFLSIASNTTEKVDSVLFDTNRVSDASFFTKVDLFKLNAFAINTFISGNKALYNQLKTETIKNDNLVKRLLNFTYIHKQFPRFGFIESIKFHVKISPGGLLTLTLNFFFLRLSAFFSNDLDLNIEEMMKKLSKSKYFSETECLKVVGAYKLLRFVKNELELITDSDQESVEENLLFKISQKYGWVPDGKILFEAVKRS